MIQILTDYVLRLNKGLGYDFNTVEFAVRGGIPYAIDFCNPAPDADVNSVGKSNFEWVVEHAARYAVECALEHRSGRNNLTWGTFLIDSTRQFSKDEKSNNKSEESTQNTSVGEAEILPPRQIKPEKRGRKPKEMTENIMSSIIDELQKRFIKPKENAESELVAATEEPKKRGRKPKENAESESVLAASELKKRGRKPKENAEIELVTAADEPEKRGRKAKENAESESVLAASEPKKRGRKPKEYAETELVADSNEPKKRGRKAKENAETEWVADSNEPKKRGRKAKENAETEWVADSNEPKKRGRKAKENAETELVADSNEPKKRGRKPDAADVGLTFDGNEQVDAIKTGEETVEIAAPNQERKKKRIEKSNLTQPKSESIKKVKGSGQKNKGKGKGTRTRIERPPISEFGIDAVNLAEQMKNNNN